MSRSTTRRTDRASCPRRPSARWACSITLDDLIGDTTRDGHVLLLVGATEGHLGQSALLHEVFNREDGDAPPVDLEAERRAGDFIRDNRQWIGACTDLSDGGLALAAFEMAVAGGVGLSVEASDTATLFRRGPGPLPDFHQLRQGRGADGRGRSGRCAAGDQSARSAARCSASAPPRRRWTS